MPKHIQKEMILIIRMRKNQHQHANTSARQYDNTKTL